MIFSPPPPHNLGLLADLPGTFAGRGFNLVAYPDRENNTLFEFDLHGTHEIIEFTDLGDHIPDRGLIEGDLTLHGLSYQHRVAGCVENAAIHLEQGLWFHVPVHGMPPSPEVYVRQVLVPKIIAVLAQSTFFTIAPGPPVIEPVYSTPFTGEIPGLHEEAATPVTDPDILKPYIETRLPAECMPPGLDAAATIWDPTRVLHAVLDEQTIRETSTIQVTTPPGGTVRLPFLARDIPVAPVAQFDAIFWIERVVLPLAPRTPYIQLQYVQRIIIEFNEIFWPHITVGTLVKMPPGVRVPPF
jgi:hypothetical protein